MSVVAPRGYKRRLYAVRAHDPTPNDITTVFDRLQTALTQRALPLKGMPPDGSPLAPEPMRTVCGKVPPHMGPFHGLKALTHGVLRAVAAERQRLAPSTPTVQRGRPASKETTARRLARPRKQIHETIRGVCQGRFLFVKRRLKPRERQPLLSITRGRPQ